MKEQIDKYSMHTDIKHWTSLVSPATPSPENVALYRQLIVGSNVLLLGSTKPLLELATVAYDLCPKYINPKITDRDWLTVDTDFDTIIGDGVFNFNKEFNTQLLEICSKHCTRMVARSFIKPPCIPKYAFAWPQATDFDIVPYVVASTEIYNFYVWDFRPEDCQLRPDQLSKNRF